MSLHGKNGFAEVSKNLARYRSENNCVGNNYVERFNVTDNAVKSFNILVASLNILHSKKYFIYLYICI